MKKLNEYINEALALGKGKRYKLFPNNREELAKMIKKEIRTYGWECDLNYIDVSKVKDLSFLFSSIAAPYGFGLQKFNGDISKWDVSKCTNFASMFKCSAFAGDISEWDTGNVETMSEMFAQSTEPGGNAQVQRFNCDISGWDVSSLKNCAYMFYKHLYFQKDLSKWNLDKNKTKFDGMFEKSSNNKLPKWYKE